MQDEPDHGDAALAFEQLRDEVAMVRQEIAALASGRAAPTDVTRALRSLSAEVKALGQRITAQAGVTRLDKAGEDEHSGLDRASQEMTRHAQALLDAATELQRGAAGLKVEARWERIIYLIFALLLGLIMGGGFQLISHRFECPPDAPGLSSAAR